MRFEVIEILLNDTITVLLSTSSRDYATRYLRWLNYKYGDFRNFAMRDNICIK